MSGKAKRPVLPPAESRAGDRQLSCVEDLLTPDEQAALAADLAHMALIRRLTGGLP